MHLHLSVTRVGTLSVCVHGKRQHTPRCAAVQVLVLTFSCLVFVARACNTTAEGAAQVLNEALWSAQILVILVLALQF